MGDIVIVDTVIMTFNYDITTNMHHVTGSTEDRSI